MKTKTIASTDDLRIVMVLILSSYIAIALGVLLLAGGYIARRREHEYSDYLLGAGGILVALGVLGLVWFIRGFS